MTVSYSHYSRFESFSKQKPETRNEKKTSTYALWLANREQLRFIIHLLNLHTTIFSRQLFVRCCLPHSSLLWQRNGFAFKDSVLFWEKKNSGDRAVIVAACRWGWGGFVRARERRFFSATESLVLIDNLTNLRHTSRHQLGHSKSYLLHIYARWRHMGVGRGCRLISSLVYGCCLLSDDAISFPWSMMAWAGHRSVWLTLWDSVLFCSDPQRPGPGHMGHGHSLDWYRQRLIRTG